VTWLDWSVFALYFAGILWIALFQSRKNQGVEGYFLANRRMPWWAIGLSVMATQASAITFIGTTGQAFDNGMGFIQFYLALPFAMVVLCLVFIPFFYRARVYTAYEYLERRFDAKTRALAGVLFLVSRGMGAGVILYAPAIVLSVILGWDERVTILVMAVVTLVYTMVGGITAVIWTDVVQMLMVFAGIVVALAAIFANLPDGVGIADAVYIGGIQDMWRSIDLSWDPTNTYTLWSGLLGGFFLFLAYFGTDQSQVQRYLTATSLTDSRLALIFNAFLKVPMQVVILSIGVLLFVFYHFEKPPLVFSPAEVAAVEASPRGDELHALEAEQALVHAQRRETVLRLLEGRHGGADVDGWRRSIGAYDAQLEALRSRAKELVAEVRGAASNDVNYVFPTYIITFIPAGLLGILVAVIFAAAMSSLDSEITALSSATVMDFYRRWLRPSASDAHYLRIARLATGFWGLFAMGVAFYAGQLGSLIEAVNQIGSFFYGSLLGVFLLAFFVKRAGGTGASLGLLVGMGTVFLVSVTTEVSWLYYNVVGAAVVVGVGWGMGLLETAPAGAGLD
jgi:SSS family transporter